MRIGLMRITLHIMKELAATQVELEAVFKIEEGDVSHVDEVPSLMDNCSEDLSENINISSHRWTPSFRFPYPMTLHQNQAQVRVSHQLLPLMLRLLLMSRLLEVITYPD